MLGRVVGYTDKSSKPRSVSRRLSPAITLYVLRILDVSVLSLAGLCTYLIHVHDPSTESWPQYVFVSVLGPVIAVVYLSITGGYLPRTQSTETSFALAATGWGVAAGALLGLGFALKILDDFSTIWALTWLVLGLTYLFESRVWLDRRVSRWSETGLLAEPCVLIGRPVACANIAERLTGTSLFRVVGVFSTNPEQGLSDEDAEKLCDLAHERRISRILIVLPRSSAEDIRAVLARLDDVPAKVQLCSDPFLVGPPPQTIEVVAGVPLFTVKKKGPFSERQLRLKRTEDVVLAAVLLALLGPLMAVIAVMVMLDSPGPVLFRQQRYRFGGAIFDIYKFRTLRDGTHDKSGLRAVTRDDLRVTRLGHWLRRTSLDELPQLMNVCRGEMSIVGPRPHPLGSSVDGVPFALAVDDYFQRYCVNPGLTGLAQISGLRGEVTSLQELRARLDCDLEYIANWSIGLDFQILLMTPVRMFADARAY